MSSTSISSVRVKNKLLPKLRFPEFLKDTEWKENVLGEVCDILNNKRKPITESDRKTGNYPYYGASGIIDYIDDYIFDERLLLIGEDGAKWGSYEKTAFIVDGKYWVNNHAHVLKPTRVVDTFLENYLIKLDISPFITGAAPPKLTLGKLKSIPIPVPKNRKEQQKIADCLSSLDDLVTAENQKLETLQVHKKGLMQNLFPAEGETAPNIRFPEFSEGWKKVKLKDVSLYFNGGSYENDVKVEGKYELITLKSINTNGKLVNSKRYVDIEVPTLTKGTLVMILSEQAPGLLGMTAIIPTGNKYVLNQRVAEIRPNQKVESYFLSMAINRNQNYFSKHGAGTKVQNISKPNVENYEFLLPEILEQQKIASCLSSLDEQIETQNQKIETLNLHKKGLMQNLFPNFNGENV